MYTYVLCIISWLLYILQHFALSIDYVYNYHMQVLKMVYMKFPNNNNRNAIADMMVLTKGRSNRKRVY